MRRSALPRSQGPALGDHSRAADPRSARGGRDGGKRSHGARTGLAGRLLAAAERAGCDLSETAHDAVMRGFGAGADGEDRFDAMVGTLGIVKHLRAAGATEAPSDPSVRLVEGWMVGQKPPLALSFGGGC